MPLLLIIIIWLYLYSLSLKIAKYKRLTKENIDNYRQAVAISISDVCVLCGVSCSYCVVCIIGFAGKNLKCFSIYYEYIDLTNSYKESIELSRLPP
jgi:hypothetical protein